MLPKKSNFDNYLINLDINETEVRPLRKRINIEDINQHNYDVKISPDLSDDILATGPRYQLSDLKCLPISKLGEHTSGVCRKLY